MSETTGSDEVANTPAPEKAYVGTGTTASCTPNVALGDPIAQPLSSFTCPSGFQSRARNAALPVSGRFETAREMVDALCTQSSDPATDPVVPGVDFDKNDVLAVAYDGEVGLYRRGTELWIRQTEGCSRVYDTALFVIPKSAEPHEQTCSATCE